MIGDTTNITANPRQRFGACLDATSQSYAGPIGWEMQIDDARVKSEQLRL